MSNQDRIELLGAESKLDRNKWSRWRHANYKYFTEKLSNLDKTLRLIDLGAGSVPFRDLFCAFKYTGVDCVRFPDVSVVADFEKSIPIQNEKADIITISNVLEHVSHPMVLLSECERILAPGGRIIGTVPFIMKAHQVPYDFNRYTVYQIRNMLEEVGFSQIEVIPLGSLVDAYDTIELKFFALAHPESVFLLYILRVLGVLRRVEMRVIRFLSRSIFAHEEYSEGYGFYAVK